MSTKEEEGLGKLAPTLRGARERVGGDRAWRGRRIKGRRPGGRVDRGRFSEDLVTTRSRAYSGIASVVTLDSAGDLLSGKNPSDKGRSHGPIVTPFFGRRLGSYGKFWSQY